LRAKESEKYPANLSNAWRRGLARDEPNAPSSSREPLWDPSDSFGSKRPSSANRGTRKASERWRWANQSFKISTSAPEDQGLSSSAKVSTNPDTVGSQPKNKAATLQFGFFLENANNGLGQRSHVRCLLWEARCLGQKPSKAEGPKTMTSALCVKSDRCPMVLLARSPVTGQRKNALLQIAKAPEDPT